jgi:hypothetical protein
MFGIGLSKGLGLKARKPSGPPAIDITDKTVALFGDSMSDQQTDLNVFESLGYMILLQMVTGHRYIFNNNLNFGVSRYPFGQTALISRPMSL